MERYLLRKEKGFWLEVIKFDTEVGMLCHAVTQI